MGVGRHLLDPETEARLLASEPRLDLEISDPLRASTLTLKFVAVKTPFNTLFPRKLYFTFKFFNFHTVHTETVFLKSQEDVLKGGTQYLLARDGGDGNSLTRIFDVDPSLNTTDNGSDEHMQFARYLKDRVLTVELWNGDSLMHFGTCKVPLNAFMRQGEPSKVVAQEYDVCEPEFGSNVGALQLLITNEGRKIPALNISPDKNNNHRHKKKVLSKPIDTLQQIIQSEQTLATAYEYTKQTQSTMLQSEEARKKLRVDRLKKNTANFEISSSMSLNNPQASEWDKMASLKHIEMLRETKKHNLLERVMKESLAFK